MVVVCDDCQPVVRCGAYLCRGEARVVFAERNLLHSGACGAGLSHSPRRLGHRGVPEEGKGKMSGHTVSPINGLAEPFGINEQSPIDTSKLVPIPHPIPAFAKSMKGALDMTP